MQRRHWIHHCCYVVCAFLCGLGASCGERATRPEETNNAQLLAGTWILQITRSQGNEAPAIHGQKRLIIKDNGAFRLFYRDDSPEHWSLLREGILLYKPPVLTLFFQTGGEETLQVLDGSSDRLVLRVGRSLVPAREQLPDEVYVKEPSSNPSTSPSAPGRK